MFRGLPQLIKNLLFSEKEFNHYDFNINILSDQKPSFKNRIELAECIKSEKNQLTDEEIAELEALYF